MNEGFIILQAVSPVTAAKVAEPKSPPCRKTSGTEVVKLKGGQLIAPAVKQGERRNLTVSEAVEIWRNEGDPN